MIILSPSATSSLKHFKFLQKTLLSTLVGHSVSTTQSRSVFTTVRLLRAYKLKKDKSKRQKWSVQCIYNISNRTDPVFFWTLNCLWDEETSRRMGCVLSTTTQTQYNIRYYNSSSARVMRHQHPLYQVNLLEFWQRRWIYEEVSEPVFFESWEVSGYRFFVRRFDNYARWDASCYRGRPTALQHKHGVFETLVLLG